MKKLATAIAVLSALGLAQSAHAITVDSDLSDWGINVIDGGDTGVNPTGPGGTDYSGLLGGVNHMIEDTNDAVNGYFLDPWMGGQDFDAEFMGVKVEGSTLYLAIMSGQRTDNDQWAYIPGDVMFNTTGGTYGMEFNGVNYVLNSNAAGTGVTFASHSAGDMVFDASWTASPLNGVATQMNADGTVVGGIGNGVEYSLANVGTTHSVLEVAINMDIFGNDTLNSIRWAPACDNDFVEVPAPHALALLGLGLLGLTAARRQKKA